MKIKTVAVVIGAAAGMCLASVADAAKPQQCSNQRPDRHALAAALQCNMDLRDAARSPVILVPGTTLTPGINWSWNYVPALDAMGWPVCTVELPDNALADIQTSAEHVVYAIREAYRLSGHRVQIIGFSQGGMVPRWALRFSPDTRRKVDDLISLSGSHHASLTAEPLCSGAFAGPDQNGVVGCEPAIWQQVFDSDFITALNRNYETVPEVDYTAAYTHFDDVLISNQPGVPTPPSSELRDGGDNVANLALQDVCPSNMANHRAIGTFDPVGYAIALDALTHPGPASLERLLDGGAPGMPSVCAETYMPGVDPANVEANLADHDAHSFQALFVDGEHLTKEPAPRCYTRGEGPKR